MRRTAVLLVSTALLLLQACAPAAPPRILVFSKTAGYRHASIDAGKRAIIALGEVNGFGVDTTEDVTRFREDSLRNYAAIVFLNTTGNVLDRASEVELQRYIQAGGGFVGVHAAADAEYDWRWYGRLVGAYFVSHPAIQQATLRVQDRSHASTEHLPESWARTDEWYNFKDRIDSMRVLLAIDENSYQGGANGADHPMAWYHEYDGGRAWYTGLGHTEESYADSLFLQHLLGGIRYAMGNKARLQYSRATAQHPPSDSLFEKVLLTSGTLTEPTEMAVLPNGDVLIAQRGGELALYKDADRSMRNIDTLDVYSRSGVRNVNAEEGLMGIALDPAFAENRFLYLFYSPRDSSVNRLSRFVFDGDSLHRASEKVVLELYSQRRICCHTGGSIAFDAAGNLYLSTGDNTTPFDEAGEKFATHGYGPTDDRPGHLQYDARRSSANTNDLRGKVLRIKVRPDGGYDIPAGNLFAPGTPNTRPEIYVMGTRNAYRISIDAKRGHLYWGDVGPDAANDSLTVRGPRGYDEINQARSAGNYGWPMFVGANYAYREWNYATGKTGAPYNADAPMNTSRNNTGVQSLPPAQPAFIWYPYGDSPQFPQLGNGGRTAMAGPVYYRDRITSPHAAALPAYYDGKLFIYDWIRHWIFAVTLQENGDYERMERVMSSATFAAPIDMELGADGRLYILEYGKGWFTKNPDAGLSRIEYRGR